MEGGRPARGGAGGGGSIQAASQARARVVASLAALLGAAGIAGALVLQEDARFWLVAAFGGASVVLLALALAFALPSLLPWPLVGLAAAYALHLGDGQVDQWSPVYAGAFVGVAELAYWSLELRGRAQEVERLTERRAALIVALAVGAVALGGLVLAATSLELGSGIALDLIGVVAAIGALAVLAIVARPRRGEPDRRRL